MPGRMDAAGAVDAQNAPTAPWKTAQTAVSHSAHTHHRWSGERRREPAAGNRLTHEIPDTPVPPTKSSLPYFLTSLLPYFLTSSLPHLLLTSSSLPPHFSV